MMFMQFESISRLRFNRGTVRLKSQSNLEELADHIMDSNMVSNSTAEIFLKQWLRIF